MYALLVPVGRLGPSATARHALPSLGSRKAGGIVREVVRRRRRRRRTLEGAVEAPTGTNGGTGSQRSVMLLPQKFRQAPRTAIGIFSRPTAAACPDTAFLLADKGPEPLRQFAMRSTAGFCRAVLPRKSCGFVTKVDKDGHLGGPQCRFDT